MNQYDNPAGRLDEILKRLKPETEKEQVGDVWARALDVPKANMALLLKRMGMVHQLPLEIRQAVGGLHLAEPNKLLWFMPKLEQALAVTNFRAPFQTTVGQHLGADVRNGLGALSAVLSGYGAGASVAFDPEELKELRDQIVNLIDDVRESDLPEDLRHFVLEQLDDVLDAIQDYWIAGVEPVRDAVQKAVGATVLTDGESRRLEKRPLGKRFLEILHIAIAVVSLASNSLELADAAEPILTAIRNPRAQLEAGEPGDAGES